MGGTEPFFDGFCERCILAGDEHFPEKCGKCDWDFIKSKPTLFEKFKKEREQ